MKTLHRMLIMCCSFLATGACSLSPSQDASTAFHQSLESLRTRPELSFQGNTQVSLPGVAFFSPVSFEGIQRQGELIIIHKLESSSQSEKQMNTASENLDQWNPLVKLAELEQMRYTAKWNTELSNGAEKVVQIEPDSEEALNRFKAYLIEQWERVKSDSEREWSTTSKQLLPEEAAKADQELKRALQASRAEFDKMLASLQIKQVYHFWLNSAAAPPSQLMITTEMNYKQEEEDKQETTITTYQFDAGKSPEVLPDSSF